jgi:hypothetical protein
MDIRDHYPANDATRPMMREAYIGTRELYEKLYGTADPEVWPQVDVTCGDSYSGLPAPEATSHGEPCR